MCISSYINSPSWTNDFHNNDFMNKLGIIPIASSFGAIARVTFSISMIATEFFILTADTLILTVKYLIIRKITLEDQNNMTQHLMSLVYNVKMVFYSVIEFTPIIGNIIIYGLREIDNWMNKMKEVYGEH